jgi:single-stranded-DNA-specific exonuclease
MKAQSMAKFMEAQKAAARSLKNLLHRKAAIIHHNDTDGVSSGAILKAALQREGFQTENIPIERVHPSFLPKIHTPDRSLIFYADLGSQAAGMISRETREGSSVIILDHHPPFQKAFPNLVQVNPEIFEIDGDFHASAASVAFFFARTLHPENDNLAYLAVIGSIGDNQIVEGRMTGLNQMALKIAQEKGTIQPGSAGISQYGFPLFKGDGGAKVSRALTDLAVNGYYRGGAQMAVKVCLEGYTGDSLRFAAAMREIQEGRFEKERQRIQTQGISSRGEVQWVDVAARFYPLGLKSIGLFCEEIIRAQWVHRDQYVLGFQDFPREVPLLGNFEGEDIKVSARVTAALREDIEKRRKPHLADLLPRAAREAGGFAEGCHRFAAACIIPRKNKIDLIDILNNILNSWSDQNRSSAMKS